MNNPEEKAKELVRKYWDLGGIDIVRAKQCALIAVNEILEDLDLIIEITGSSFVLEIIEYYQQVKQEIQKL